MPLDKQKSGTPAKPFTPTLSTAFRNTKSPLTPKLAGSKNASPASSPRRHLRSESTTTPTSGRDDFRIPTASKLNGNVTPRSGARLSRIGGESPSTLGGSDTGTPSRSRPLSAIELSNASKDSPNSAGLGISSLNDKRSTCTSSCTVPAGSVVSGGRARGVSTGSATNAAAESISPMFFRANDAPSSVTFESEERSKVGNPATFFYASDAARRTNSPDVLRPTLDIFVDKDQQGKWFYVDNRPSEQLSMSQKQTTGLKTSPTAITSSQPYAHSNQLAPRILHRPPSPIKPPSFWSAPATICSSKGDSVKSPSSSSSYKASTSGTNSVSPSQGSTGSETSTVGRTIQRKLSKANSRPSTPPPSLNLHIGPVKTQEASGKSPTPLSLLERFSPRSTSLGSSNTGVSTQSLDSTSSTSLLPLSPSKSETRQPTQLQKTNELAANARRERKVLDLEISNSSLLAINRTLEREMRKQSMELRRFRRLSRSGRLSLATASMRSTSGLSTLAESDNGDGPHVNFSDLDEDKSESEGDDDDLDSSFNDDSSLLSPTSYTDHDSRHRARDEKRLMLDLSKHQQLLIDSQKMNQSIKRCLTWTDDLISEARKALDYNVKVSDVELGGKVLARDEEQDEGGGGSSKALLSPSLANPILTEMDWGLHAMEASAPSEEEVG